MSNRYSCYTSTYHLPHTSFNMNVLHCQPIKSFYTQPLIYHSYSPCPEQFTNKYSHHSYYGQEGKQPIKHSSQYSHPHPGSLQVNKRKEKRKSMGISEIEDEISFLADECTSILILLDSLRNAFSTDTSTENMTIAIKKAKEKEIKTAYDGLVLQVWQLEKKIESLEKKSIEMISDNQQDCIVNSKRRRQIE